MSPRVVISLHGIKARGVWQKDLAPELALAGFVPYALDYGDFGGVRLLRRGSLDKSVNWLVGEYDRIKAGTGCQCPSVIAHSFGALQVAHLLEKYAHVTFDKVILAGGLVPVAFQWAKMLSEHRVEWVLNEYGCKDLWPRIARLVVPHAGNSGTTCFSDVHRALHQVDHPYHGHSDYFSQGNFRHNWIPTLLLNKRAIVDDLHGLIGILASEHGLARVRLRCFVLALAEAAACLKVVPGVQAGAASGRECELAVPLDSARDEAEPAIAFKQMREVRWSGGGTAIPCYGIDQKPSLFCGPKWHIALPIPLGVAMEAAVGVLIIDGLDVAPQGALARGLLKDDNVFTILIKLGERLAEAQFHHSLGGNHGRGARICGLCYSGPGSGAKIGPRAKAACRYEHLCADCC